MLISTGLFALQAILDFLTALFLFRFYLFLIRFNLGTYQPELSRWVTTMTDWAVLKLRRVIPPLRSFDIASLIPAVLLQLAFLLIHHWSLSSHGQGLQFILQLIFNLLDLIIHGLVGILFISVVISWVQPHSAMQGMMNKLSDPILDPIRRVIPLIGGLDLSALVALLALQVIQRLLPAVFFG
jgi:YggT family protein